MKQTELRNARMGESIHSARLEDGLPVFISSRPGFLKGFAIIATNYGSLDNEFVPVGSEKMTRYPEGIAHFLEHKLFEDQAGDIFDQFARLGASANAFTSHAVTAYHYSAAETFYECLDLLLDFVADPYFTEESIEKERKVIAQEIRMYDDLPDQRGHLNLLKNLYHRHPIREDIPGTVQSIKEITKAQLESCYHTFYRPENMVLCVAADVDPKECLDRVAGNAARRHAKYGAPKSGPIVRAPIVEPAGVHRARFEEKHSVSRPHVWIGWKGTPEKKGEKFIRREFEVAFLLDLLIGRSTEFYEKHYESGLVDGTFGASYVTERDDHAYLVIEGETDDPDALVRAVDERLAEARARGLDEEDFARIRSKAFGRFLRSFNSLEYVGTGYAEAFLQGWDFLRYLDILEPVSMKDLMARLGDVFPDEGKSISIVRPS
ncbi:MAG: M16 family metallopeptidase [Planctomycetota bacterium]